MLHALLIYMRVFGTYIPVMGWLNATRKKEEKTLGMGSNPGNRSGGKRKLTKVVSSVKHSGVSAQL